MEGDFALHYHTDYRDVYRPGGGPSRLTLRRLSLLVERLPPESAFKSAVEDRLPISGESAVTMTVFEALTGKKHPLWTAKQRERERAEHEAAVRAARERARKFNRPRHREGGPMK